MLRLYFLMPTVSVRDEVYAQLAYQVKAISEEITIAYQHILGHLFGLIACAKSTMRLGNVTESMIMKQPNHTYE